MVSPTEINLRRVLVGHRAAVNVVDFDEKYIVSASGDRTIKVSSFLHNLTFYDSIFEKNIPNPFQAEFYVFANDLGLVRCDV